jgi:hypothetical protein
MDVLNQKKNGNQIANLTVSFLMMMVGDLNRAFLESKMKKTDY